MSGHGDRYELRTVAPSIAPRPRLPGIEGNGEGVEYLNATYFYRTPHRIPKDKVAAVRYEGNYCGRQRGEICHLILAWNGVDFTVLESCFGTLKRDIARYRGLSPAEAIQAQQERLDELRRYGDSFPKCRVCRNSCIIIGDNQPSDVCYSCWDKVSSEETQA